MRLLLSTNLAVKRPEQVFPQDVFRAIGCLYIHA